MNQSSDNPSTNVLGPGIDEMQVKSAIEQSGYPLQSHVADALRTTKAPNGQSFHVSEEWSYVDRDTGDLRSIDLHGTARLHTWNPQPRIRPTLNLLIECKHSQLPFIFFMGRGKAAFSDYPSLAGLKRDKVVIKTDDDPSSWTLPVILALGLRDDIFYTQPPFCHTFSKCVRRGSEIELSGSEAYNGLVLPLVKAVQHFKRSRSPADTAFYFDCGLTLGVGVVEAPMIAGVVENGITQLIAQPWVRVIRHEHHQDAERFERDQYCVVDVVHKDFFATYLTASLLPFAQRFAERVLRHPTELATGEGFVAGMGSNPWSDIESRLTPRSEAQPPEIERPRLSLVGRDTDDT
jgi:hypothetical protein